MPYANNNGTKIYYELRGSGTPIIFMHGLSSDLTSWYDYAAALGSFQSIMIDTRGHGKSDKPSLISDYRFDIVVKDVCAVLDDLGIAQAHYIGYSMGGFNGCAMAKYAPERLLSLTIGGATPFGISHTNVEIFRMIQGTLETAAELGVAGFIEYHLENFGPLDPEFKSRILKSDVATFRAQALVPESLISELSDFSAEFNNLTIPRMIYLGSDDELISDDPVQLSNAFPDAHVISIPGHSHSGNAQKPLIIREISAFLEV